MQSAFESSPSKNEVEQASTLQMSYEEIIKTATVVMEEEPEQIGFDEDQTETKSLREVLLASQRLKASFAKICDVKTFDISGKPSAQGGLSYYSFNESKLLAYLYAKYLAV
jgi:hypothetical protein